MALHVLSDLSDVILDVFDSVDWNNKKQNKKQNKNALVTFTVEISKKYWWLVSRDDDKRDGV